MRVEGIVQGVGFRPFVHRLATALDLTGHVVNDSQGVILEVQGRPAAVEELITALRVSPPTMAVIDRIATRRLDCVVEQGFRIAPSPESRPPSALVSPDVATCDACLAEIMDPTDRRYRYAFANCTNCGPRFTIVTGIPYDRPNTTMAGFRMCAACRKEYDDPADRRFHAQPTCCSDCGPALEFTPARTDCPDPILATAAALCCGYIVAVKGLGGYHLAALATDEEAVSRLRRRKHREDKPFAVMVRDVAAAGQLVVVDDDAAAALATPQRPIVLLPRRTSGGSQVAPAVAPGVDELGIMLPYTPLHHLLLREIDAPIVLTSGNISDEPIAYHDDDARQRLTGIADAFLSHNRPIHVRTDDSVVRISAGAATPLRRSRGFAPAPIRTRLDSPRTILGCGAELKNTFAFGRAGRVFVSHHIGDLENVEALQSFTDGIAHFQRLFDLNPDLVAHDIHPEYLSTKWALDQLDVDLLPVQHHHAHIASCLADNGITTPVIGVAFDGLGYGTDDTLWGGELLLADLAGFDRLSHLRTVPMPGGAVAIREPWRMAVAWLQESYDDELPEELGVLRRHESQWRQVASVGRSSLSPRTSSVGRLFDAVAAMCDLYDVTTYEGQAAIALEKAVDRTEDAAYPLPCVDGELDGRATIRAVVDDLSNGVSRSLVAARFHNGLAAATAAVCAAFCAAHNLRQVALSGGVFQNQWLLHQLIGRIEAAGLDVATHRQVPTNDGGISLGQVAVAAAQRTS